MSENPVAPESFSAPEDGSVDLLIIAGEHSGDEHAALMLKDLKAKRPDLKVACLGGAELQAAGAQLLYDLTAVSIVGFVEVLKHYGFFKTLFACTVDWIERYAPRHVCFVDYPGFNLRLAEQLHRQGLSQKGGGQIGLSYYIGPQIWAWKAKRRFKMAEVLDRLGVIFPFEVDCFKDTDLPVEFVGHPFARPAYQLPFRYAVDAPVLLLPGSRRAAVERIFPTLLAGFEKALEKEPDLQALVVYPGEGIRRILDSVLTGFPELKDRVRFLANEEQTLEARAVLMSSGTMSLAVALSGIPGAIAYRLNPFSYLLGRMIIKIDYIGISNLLLQRPLHPEYIQGAASAENLGAALIKACQVNAGEEAMNGALELREILEPDSGANASDWLLTAL